MNKLITVPLPINIQSHEFPLYEPYTTYEVYPQKVKTFKNVFVGNSGFCMNSRGLISECHHNYPQQMDYYQNEAASHYYDAADNPDKMVVLDDDNVYLVIHHPWFNYYHWICESIFRLWMVKDKLDKLILVLPDYYKDAGFIQGSIEPFGIKKIYYIPPAKSLMVKNICLPQIKPVCDSYDPKDIKKVRNFYCGYVSAKEGISAPKIAKLYVSRKFAGRRGIVNEDEMLPVLEKYGFTIFHPEHFSFLEQVAIFSRLKYLVGMHGSGLTNMLFMANGTSVLELHQNQTNELNHPSPLFWYMAQPLGMNYYHQSCQTHGKEDYFEGEYLVDVKLLDQNLALMLNGR